MGKMKENKLRWFGHVMRVDKRKMVKVVMKMNVQEREEEKTEENMDVRKRKLYENS